MTAEYWVIIFWLQNIERRLIWTDMPIKWWFATDVIMSFRTFCRNNYSLSTSDVCRIFIPSMIPTPVMVPMMQSSKSYHKWNDTQYSQVSPTIKEDLLGHSLYYSYPKLVVLAVLQSPIKMNYESRGVTHLPTASCASTPACFPSVSSKLGEEMDRSFNLQLRTATMAVLRTLLQRREMAWDSSPASWWPYKLPAVLESQ